MALVDDRQASMMRSIASDEISFASKDRLINEKPSASDGCRTGGSGSVDLTVSSATLMTTGDVVFCRAGPSFELCTPVAS